MAENKKSENKRLKALAVLLLTLLLAGCSNGIAPTAITTTSVTTSKSSPTITTPTKEANKTLTDQQKAEISYQALIKNFYKPEVNLYLEHAQPLSDDKAYSYLWPYSGVISALNALATMPNGGDKYRADLKRVLDGLEQYWDPNGQPPAYDSYVVQFGGGQKFYDDNEWLGLDFIEAYHTLKDPKYLDKAKATFDFAISGWSDDFGGGIYWREFDSETKNTCSNGPAAVLALKLYQETKDVKYLDWAKKILDWVKQLKSPNGVYWDHLKLGGEIDERTFTYNTGTIIHANALFYQLTGDKAYLAEAQALAKSSQSYFITLDKQSGLSFYPDTPWFNAVLYKGYVALYEADPNHDPQFINSMRANLEYVWEHARDDDGLFSLDWTGQTGVLNPNKWLLDQAPIVELYALFTRLN